MKRFVLCVLLAVCILIGTGCVDYSVYVPKEGIWYCEDLAIWMNFDNNGISYAIIDGIKIRCCVSYERGSGDISVIYQELTNVLPDYFVGESVWDGLCVGLEDGHLQVKGEDGKIYLFIRSTGDG